MISSVNLLSNGYASMRNQQIGNKKSDKLSFGSIVDGVKPETKERVISNFTKWLENNNLDVSVKNVMRESVSWFEANLVSLGASLDSAGLNIQDALGSHPSAVGFSRDDAKFNLALSLMSGYKGPLFISKYPKVGPPDVEKVLIDNFLK